MTESHSILVVDDESESLALLTGILVAEGYHVRSANSGQLALASVAAWLPRLILLDIRMPGIDGFEVCRRLKAREETRNIPLLFISAARDAQERVKGLALGAVDYIIKPFQRDELLARVRTHLELGRLRTQLETQVSEKTAELGATIERLRESEERFRNMADTAPVMIWVSGPDKGCTFFNECWLTFTGRTIKQEQGNGWTEGIHPEDAERCMAIYSTSFDVRQSFEMEYRLRRADSGYRWVLDRGVPRFAPGGVFAGYIGSCIDITDLKRTQNEILATQKLESVGALANGIAHDFNNLLGGILAEAEIAAMELKEGDSPLGGVERIMVAAKRGAEIVRELMIYSGEDREDPVEPIDVARLVEEMLELLKVSISKHAVLQTDLGQNLPAVPGRASQIRQIVMNLIINSSEAIGEKDGVIRVTLSRITLPRPAGANTPRLPSGDYLILEVSDTGGGMTEDAQAKIFDPFFSTKFAGRGLGLAVVQGIVRDHSGAINLVSELGLGTRFEIFLPCVGDTAPADHHPIAAASEKEDWSPAGTVLVVEDEELLRFAISKMLRMKGLKVIEAMDGFSALELVRAHKEQIDVMLLDVTLPGMSSREVLEEALNIRPDLKAILTSAYSKESVDASFVGLQVGGFVRKPFQIVDLMQLLQEALLT